MKTSNVEYNAEIEAKTIEDEDMKANLKELIAHAFKRRMK